MINLATRIFQLLYFRELSMVFFFLGGWDDDFFF